MSTEVHGGYRREDKYYLIELKLNEPRQLFNSLDPSPFIDKDLDDDAESYIVDAAKEFHLDTPLKLVIHLPGGTRGALADAIPDAIHHYFAYRTQVSKRKLMLTFKHGRNTLLVGLSTLVVCLSLREVLGFFAVDTAPWRILSEGLLIGGWVAMWRPIEVLLYDWWPMLRERKILEKLQRLPIDVRHDATSP